MKNFCDSMGTVLIAALVAVAPAHAVEVSPMVSQLDPSGAKSSYRMRVKNTEAYPITVEFETYSMLVDDDGKRTLTEEQDEILVFPPQSIIPPGREQIVQVRYVGLPADQKSKMFVVRVAQLPIEVKSDVTSGTGSSMKIAFSVSTNVYVAPSKTSGRVEVRSVTRQANGDVTVSLENVGDGFALLRNATYAFTDTTGQKIMIDPGKIDVGDVSALAAGRKRNMRILAKEFGTSGTGALKLEVQLL